MFESQQIVNNLETKTWLLYTLGEMEIIRNPVRVANYNKNLGIDVTRYIPPHDNVRVELQWFSDIGVFTTITKPAIISNVSRLIFGYTANCNLITHAHQITCRKIAQSRDGLKISVSPSNLGLKKDSHFRLQITGMNNEVVYTERFTLSAN